MNKLEEINASTAGRVPAWFKYSLIHPAVSYALIAIGIFAPGIVAYFLMLFVVLANLPGELILRFVPATDGLGFPFTMAGLWSGVVLMVPLTWLFFIFPLCWATHKFAPPRP